MKKIIDFLKYNLIGGLNNMIYPQYVRPKYGYISPVTIFFKYAIPQKFLRINGDVQWPVHFTSKVSAAQNIKKGILCDPGDNPNVYIQANNGIIFGNNVGIGAGSSIISANHNHEYHSQHDQCEPIRFGNNVFVGSNSVILPGVQIGDNVVIGAGSVVTKNIPSNSIAVGNPCKVVKEKSPYLEDYSKIKLNRKLKKVLN